MNLVFVKFCLCGCLLLASLVDRARQTAGESSVASQPSRFAFLHFHFRNSSIGQEVHVESRDHYPVSVTISCPRDRNATRSSVTVQPGETMELDTPVCFKVPSQSGKEEPGIELSSNGSIKVSILLTKRPYGRNRTWISNNARLDLIPTSELGSSYLLFSPLAVTNSTPPRYVELFIVAIHDNTSVTVIWAGEKLTRAIELNGFETFSMKRRVVDARGIRILSTNNIAIFVIDSSEDESSSYSTAEKPLPTADGPTPSKETPLTISVTPLTTDETTLTTVESLLPTDETKFSTTEAPNPTAGIQSQTAMLQVRTSTDKNHNAKGQTLTALAQTLIAAAQFPTARIQTSMARRQTQIAKTQNPTQISQATNAGAHTPNAGAQTPNAGVQNLPSAAQFLKTRPDRESPKCGAPFPPSGADDLSGYFTAMQVPPDFQWSDSYRLELINCQRHRVLIGIAGASLNATRVRLKAKISDRVLTIPGNQLTLVSLAFNRMASTSSVDIEADDRIQLLIYDDTQTKRQRYNDTSTQAVFVCVLAASESFLPAQISIAAYSNSSGSRGGSDGGCRLTIRQKLNLNEGGSATTGETGNKRVVKYRYNYTSSLLASTGGFYREVQRTTGIFNLSSADNSDYFQPSSGDDSNETDPVDHRNLTPVAHASYMTDNTIPSQQIVFGNRVMEPKGSGSWEKDFNRQDSENRRTAVNLIIPELSSAPIREKDISTGTLRLIAENDVKETPETISDSSATTSNFDQPKVSASDHATPSDDKRTSKTPLKFIYRPFNEDDVRPLVPSADTNSPVVTIAPDPATYRPVSNERSKVKQKLVHKTVSLFVVKQDAVDRSGHKVVNFFEIDAAQVDQYSTQDRGISPTVIAVITSLCGAVFFVIACILGFVITEVLCVKGKLQRAKVSPCIDVSNAGY